VNQTLGQLLLQAGLPAGAGKDLWRRVIMLHNSGAVPRPESLDQDFVWRGFHLLLLDSRGTPSHFAKCRSADDEALERESRVLSVLSSDPQLERVLPRNGTANSEVLRLLLSQWVPGDTFERIGPDLDVALWREAAREILVRASLVSRRAELLLPDLLGGEDHVSAEVELEPHLTALARAGVGRQVLDPIELALQRAPLLPRRVQHGDLWPGNIIRWNDDWWLLDFEAYAQVQLPLYDVFHLLRSNPGGVRRLLATGRDGSASGWFAAVLELLKQFADDLDLDPAQVGCAYLGYLVEFTSRMHGRGVPDTFRRPYLDDLERVAEALSGGAELSDLVPLDQWPGRSPSNSV